MRFPFKAAAKPSGRNLDGNRAIEPRIASLVDGPHSPRANRFQDFLRTELRAEPQAGVGFLPHRLVQHARIGLFEQRFHFAPQLFIAPGGLLEKRGTPLRRLLQGCVIQLLDPLPTFGSHTGCWNYSTGVHSVTASCMRFAMPAWINSTSIAAKGNGCD